MLTYEHWCNFEKNEKIELFYIKIVSNHNVIKLFEKNFKKIIVKRLSYLKQISNMFDFDQINERKIRPAINAVFNLTHNIQLILNQKLIKSCLFLNVKIIFDHVSTNQLLIVLTKLNYSYN